MCTLRTQVVTGDVPTDRFGFFHVHSQQEKTFPETPKLLVLDFTNGTGTSGSDSDIKRLNSQLLQHKLKNFVLLNLLSLFLLIKKRKKYFVSANHP